MIRNFLLLIILLLTTPLSMQAQRLTVYRISGNVEVLTANSRHTLSAREVLSRSSLIEIKYGASLIVFDEKERKQYTIKTPGRSQLGALLDQPSTTVITLTERYLRYVKQQLFSQGGVAALSHNSDPATVTRDVEKALADSLEAYAALPAAAQPAQPASGANALRQRFESFKQQSTERYDNFRRDCARRYANFARLAWQEMGLEPPLERPVEPRFEPVKASAPDAALRDSQPLTIDSIVSPVAPSPAPIASAPTALSNTPAMTHADIGNDRLCFSRFATDFSLRYPAAKRCKLEAVAENFIADVIDELLQPDYDNLLADCLKQRADRHLCDWAYYQLLKTVGEQLADGDNDLATIITAFLYAESGYKMRLTIVDDHVQMFVACDHIIYGRAMLTIDGETYVATELRMGSGQACVCATAFDADERRLSLRVAQMPTLGATSAATAEGRTIRAERYPDLSIRVNIERGLLEFFDTYPASCLDGNFMTRWALYAAAPLDAYTAQQIYPTLTQYVASLEPQEATERLLNLVQTGLDYDYDTTVWGYDRTFFAEETLHYPFCDCEDRAILLTRLVRDLLHLKCALVYYPGHLACAIHFDTPTPGDYVSIDGEDYIIADPAYIGARLGQTMRGKDNASATLILLQP